MFKHFNNTLKSHFESFKGELFVTDVDPDIMWETYLASFPAGTDNLYRERTEHDCSCCRHFVKRFGNVVTVVDGELVSIWDIEPEYPYNKVCQAMSRLVKTRIKDIFLHNEKSMGTECSFEQTDNGVQTWDHFYCKTPQNAYSSNLATDRGNIRTNKEVFQRSMDELTVDAGETVLELIAQDTLYRGQEFKTAISEFVTLKKEYDKLADDVKENWCWTKCRSGFTRIRNTAIGTLLVDISNDVDLDAAVGKFEAIMAPTNYKRPKAIITKKMVKDAEEKVNELGLAESLGRRYATIDDITVNNVLFVNRSAKKKIGGSPFDDLETVKKPRTFNKVEEVKINDFVQNVLPTASKIRVMFDGKHKSNLMSLIAPDNKDAPPLFKWDNNFCWAYNGDITDSMREAVQAAGGRVDGVFRFTHSWNHDGKNQSLMDLHVFIPGHSGHKDGCHNSYGNDVRVGWNHRRHFATRGVQDVDFTAEPGKRVPVENITFPDIKCMPEGNYVCKIHNWQHRSPCTSGFKAQIEFGGQIFNYDHPLPLKHHEWVTVAVVTLKNGQFSINHKLPHDTESQTVWGVNTGDFVEVSAIMFSPNYWDDKKLGNQHYFFILNDCVNDGQPRGFFNEFLKEELTPHKRVFEALGSKMRVDPSNNQLSGLGFSTTKRDSVVVEVEGKTKRVLKVNF